MTLAVIGVGVGRTGTYSLKLAIEQLGFGPCHHMEEVIKNLPTQRPLWTDAVEDRPDWMTIYDGYGSAADWPTACFYRELSAAYPAAKFVLTHRDPETWAASFSETIFKLVSQRAEMSQEAQEWLEMVATVLAKTGFPLDLDRQGLAKAFVAHNDAVKAAIPADRLLVYQVKEGWAPLCAFLGATAPTDPFPRTNDRSEFWDLVADMK